MLLSNIKENFERKVIIKIVKKINISPKFITLFSIVLMLIASLFILNKNLQIAALFVLLSGFFDILDGSLAKIKKCTTNFGVFFDRFSDRISDTLLIGSIILTGYVDILLGIVLLSLVLISSYESAVLEFLLKTNIGEKISWRGIRLTIFIFGLLFNYIYYAAIAVTIISFYCFIERFYIAIKKLL
ncbi:MAG: CDP-alcohol phosphatidyltransferase family protein [Candidatus Aenigmatarchaeota archaeon]|nr:CDP-alcohol phosphatidyltransferase family protein [Candidatus Aenigmarchaeota archaeon]